MYLSFSEIIPPLNGQVVFQVLHMVGYSYHLYDSKTYFGFIYLLYFPLLFYFQVKVAVSVKQAEYNRTFKFQTKLSGLVLIKYRDTRKKDEKAVIQTQETELSSILEQYTGPWKIHKNVITITTEGEVDLRYFTDDKTVLREKDLEEEDEDTEEDETDEDEESQQRPMGHDDDAYQLPNVVSW